MDKTICNYFVFLHIHHDTYMQNSILHAILMFNCIHPRGGWFKIHIYPLWFSKIWICIWLMFRKNPKPRTIISLFLFSWQPTSYGPFPGSLIFALWFLLQVLTIQLKLFALNFNFSTSNQKHFELFVF